jgi:DNA-dependent RNA polymerase auxiliary subunit epsilon
MIYTSPVPIENIDDIWEQCSPLLQKATDRSNNRETIESLYSKIKSGQSRLWCISIGSYILGAATTEVIQYANFRSLNVSFLGGSKMNLWLDKFIEELKVYAKFNECSYIEFIGRKGWLKSLSCFGFKQEPNISMSLML